MSSDKKVLVLGASKHSYRYSYLATMRLLENGYPVHLLGTTGGEIMERPIIKDFPLENSIHTVTMYLSRRNQREYEDRLLELGPKRIIFNPGAENFGLSERAEKSGIEVLDACTLVMLAAGTF